MATLFSYVVDHDLGFAPNPYSEYCTLVHCKFGGESGRRNIVELADVDDWILGTGGQNKDSAGNGKLIYLMRVDERLPFRKFLSDGRFQGRSDCKDFGSGNKLALVSRRYFYFGKNAIPISSLPKRLAVNLAKRGAGFRSDYPSEMLHELVKWFGKNYENGMHGDPCGVGDDAVRVRPRMACR